MTSTEGFPMKLKLRRRRIYHEDDNMINDNMISPGTTPPVSNHFEHRYPPMETKVVDDMMDDKLEDGSYLNKPSNMGSIKLKLVRKPTASPILSIQSYIYNNIRENNPVDNIRELWDKYQKQSIHSSLIQIHKLDFDIFKDIADTILESITPYKIQIRPDLRYDMTPRISNDDLIDIDL